MIEVPELLNEVIYRLPNDGTKAFFDFYSLNWLWFRIGSGYEEYYKKGFHPGKIASYKRQQVIDDVFDKCARELVRDW
jgi:hypothetical protein